MRHNGPPDRRGNNWRQGGAGLYFVMVLLFGGLSALIAVPLAGLGAVGLASFFAGFLNFDLDGFRLDPWIVALQVGIVDRAAVGRAVADLPQGAHHRAWTISEYGLGKGQLAQA
ncbi:MAG: hypothetical protein R2932_27425 [Caldilineaceae bacterium]